MKAKNDMHVIECLDIVFSFLFGLLGNHSLTNLQILLKKILIFVHTEVHTLRKLGRYIGWKRKSKRRHLR